MKKLRLIVALCLIISISAVALAAAETLDLGPASISLDLETIGPCAVKMGDSYSSDHNYDLMNSDFDYTIYPASITFGDSSSQLLLEVHQMGASEPLDTPISKKDKSTGLEHCIREADMMPRGTDVSMKSYTIGGREGILATVDSGKEDPMYIVAYSPDQKDGSGTIVCIVGSNFPWETTESIFASIETQVA